MDKEDALKAALEIAKESARGGNNNPDYVLEQTYKKIIQLVGIQ